ncbi:peptidoglycan editing factor PgeF [Ketogulonicigenium vulgare]|uniref:Purine nucleoside phosphorylase n=1 Tax=Ketogulonicigenium vulgare (strain WSH-001) TaxID=759362 RepID=F9YAE0_KETVW|nr:peptidoglycan editing factor PgeF [Ketogulonicigenium vulgare]ADO42103.1 conserved hypothetical protein [Ketogulonicigenium vulgare Y25]AEM40313.1 hypothetical protein KVU_0474 [Ketogulonicigenium vulgare WSH-001]ALJ80508.1 polyphenol oxidase [Ketogulonicigenium vulgare]ANW33333.1 polyphenol oxidase [Ketogulonicigenium vulgare]AOZ54023.1 hypothetical protein KVC_1006 [Ketogulonicigenium vulgare]
MSLDIITSDALVGVRHGFFGRAGGASSGVFAGLNCGLGSTDQREVVLLNRARVAAAMGVAATALIGVNQVHSADVVVVSDSDTPRPAADAMVTNVPGIALGILTADCQPVLFADVDAGVIGAAHAGWKGTRAGVLEATVDAMIPLGARRDQITAVIGPTISQRVYEVGADFRDNFIAADPDAARFFVAGAPGKYQFDLPGFGLSRLRRTGIKQAEWTRHCTYCDPKRFFSYRRTTHEKEADYGRLISVIRL